MCECLCDHGEMKTEMKRPGHSEAEGYGNGPIG